MIHWCPFTEIHSCSNDCVFLRRGEVYIDSVEEYAPTYTCLLAKAAEGLADAFSDMKSKQLL